MKKQEVDSPSYYSFFKESEKDFLSSEVIDQSFEEQWLSKKADLPKLQEGAQKENKNMLKNLRMFYLTGANPQKLDHPKEVKSAFRAGKNLNQGSGINSFPLWINTHRKNQNTPASEPFSTILLKACDQLSTSDKIKQTLFRETIRIVDELITAESIGSSLQMEDINEEIRQIPQRLRLTKSTDQSIISTCNELGENLPSTGKVLFYTSHLQEEMLKISLNLHQAENKIIFLQEIDKLVVALQDLIQIDDQDNANKNSDQLKNTVGKVADFMDTTAWSKLQPESSSQKIDKERKTRIQQLIKTLKKGHEILKNKAFILTEWEVSEVHAADFTVENLENPAILKEIEQRFEDWMEPIAQLFAAMKISKMELKETYISEELQPYFEHFSWQKLSKDELRLAPPFIIRIKASTLYNSSLPQLLNLLGKNIPVRFFIQEDRPFSIANSDHFNMANLAMTTRYTYVCQTTGWMGNAFFDHLCNGLDYTGPSVFYFLYPNAETTEDFGWKNELALLSRTFPHFTYRGNDGRWGQRFALNDNPDTALNWFNYSINCSKENQGEELVNFQLTPAELLLEQPSCAKQFIEIPADFTSEKLVELTEFISMTEEESQRSLPFIRALNTDNYLIRLMPGEAIVNQVKERLDQWHALLDLGGIKSFQVETALSQQRSAMDQKFQLQIEELQVEFEAKIVKAREEGSATALENLASFLLDFDSKVEIPSPSTPKEAKKEVKEKEEKVEKEEVAPQKEAPKLIAEEAYIDTPLCTTCNECTDLNNRMFKYNADKLAYIADIKAGTYNELVMAAEKCPAGIIHPGAPLNKEEKGLEDLMKRAEKYNG